MKFGGSSIANPERIKHVAQIVRAAAKNECVVVVLSAFQGVTNSLLECARLAESGQMTYLEVYDDIVLRHRNTLNALFGKKKQRAVLPLVNRLLAELRDALHGISLLKHSPPRAMDLVASFGERLSTLMFAAYVNVSKKSMFVDARECVVTDDAFMNAVVNFDLTNPKTKKYFNRLYRKEGKNVIAVVTGFIGATEDGRTTTIGRNGSDYSAAIIGGALEADVIEIWTDVDGVLSADPRAVPSAFVLPSLSYEEAMEMSYFGASVLHSATIAPAVARSIPIVIKNTFNPTSSGTTISSHVNNWIGVAKGISSIDNITLLTLRGLSMVGVPGIARRLFGALADAKVSVILISQASSEHTICFAVSSGDTPRARKAILHEFRYDLQNKLTALDEKPSQSIMAVVGEGMRGTPGVSGKVFQTLGQSGVNISAIAQGASERNISFVVDSSNKKSALNVLHEAFFNTKKVLSLVVVGVGNVGAELLRQLHERKEFLAKQGFEIRVVALANSKHTFLDLKGIDLANWRDALHAHASKTAGSLSFLCSSLKDLNYANVALIDCTAHRSVVDMYPDFIKAGCHIVTPNKLANVAPMKRYDELMALFRKHERRFFYEANVGAGLPVIQTLKDLVATGDRIQMIEGTLSGTLSFLFNNFDGMTPFSHLVREAEDLGYTEPDPREDLSGNDVARKLLIMAREMGQRLDLADVRVQNLVPPPLRKGMFTGEFYKHFARFDDVMLRRLAEARKDNAVLRYVGTLANGKAVARLQTVSINHPFASAKGSESIFVFTSKRYAQQPLVVRGHGAGAEVTAMGVFSDILKLLQVL